MLTPIEIYKKFLLKVNKNDTNANIKVPISQFVFLFNGEKRRWLDDVTKTKESSDYIEDIEFLLEVDVPLTRVTTTATRDDFAGPSNYFKRVSSYCLASKDKCKNVLLYNWYIKAKNLNVLLQNENQKPSFEYGETLALMNNDKVSIYKDGFSVNKVFFTYYREPADLDIAGYRKIDGSLSTNVQIDLDDISIEEIIDRTVVEALRNYESTEQVQLALQRQQLDEKNEK